MHDEVVNVIWQGADPIPRNEYRDKRLIESAVSRPFQTVFGADAYPSMTDKAVALFHSLISNHAFYNGNRTAVIALDHFLVASILWPFPMKRCTNWPSRQHPTRNARYRMRLLLRRSLA
ncbi:MAG: hypothetical protein DMG32_17965 [Acidobacteria bacterium]|nr:MAG: hypothetical protein DMG32_17965 [Acidobacteriota bacterium]